MSNKSKNIGGRVVRYLSVYRAGRSQYEDAFVYYVEAEVDGSRVVHHVPAANSIRAAKEDFEVHLARRAKK